MSSPDIIIYHNPDCGTSRNTLAMIRNAGIEPHVIEYLKTPPARALLLQLIERAGLTPRALLREKGTPYAELGLGDPTLSDEQLVDAMMAHPILINRPLVVSRSASGSAGHPRSCWTSCPNRSVARSPRKTAKPSSTPQAAASPNDYVPRIQGYPDAGARHLPHHACLRHLATARPRHRLERDGRRRPRTCSPASSTGTMCRSSGTSSGTRPSPSSR